MQFPKAHPGKYSNASSATNTGVAEAYAAALVFSPIHVEVDCIFFAACKAPSITMAPLVPRMHLFEIDDQPW